MRRTSKKTSATCRKRWTYIDVSSLTVRGNNTLKTAHSYRTRGQAGSQLCPGENFQEQLICSETASLRRSAVRIAPALVMVRVLAM